MTVATKPKTALRIAFQMDPIGPINIDADSSFRLAEEAQARGAFAVLLHARASVLSRGTGDGAGMAAGGAAGEGRSFPSG